MFPFSSENLGHTVSVTAISLLDRGRTKPRRSCWFKQDHVDMKRKHYELQPQFPLGPFVVRPLLPFRTDFFRTGCFIFLGTGPSLWESVNKITHMSSVWPATPQTLGNHRSSALGPPTYSNGETKNACAIPWLSRISGAPPEVSVQMHRTQPNFCLSMP